MKEGNVVKTERQDEMGLLWMRTDWPSGKEADKTEQLPAPSAVGI